MAFLSDILAIAFGFTPYISCTVLPAWQELAEPFASILTLCGLVMWVWSRLRNRIWLGLMLVGIVLGIGPWLMSYVLNPLC
ncbi:hypothetical protein LJR030_003638 [Rhizobium sp. LjRoot30]|uniref:hypothetical protein n=1 Tax=Rhizobium sp. LjRoot30 TaxID=3342320 RepID=UPI003ECC6EFE